MAIKIRVSTDDNAVCSECGSSKEDSLDMFDLMLAGQVFHLCDLCNTELLNKTLKAEVYKNGRVKEPRDRRIISMRGQFRSEQLRLEREERDKHAKHTTSYRKTKRAKG